MIDKIQQTLVIKRLYLDKNENTKRLTNGKYCSQASHASISFITRKLKHKKSNNFEINLTEEEKLWIDQGFTKICLYVDTEEELIDVYNKAKDQGLTVHIITDAGHTEFNGVPTKTCLAIGPHYKSKIDPITKDLKLF